MNSGVMMASPRRFFLLLAGFISALYLSWMVNAAAGYGYQWLYHIQSIDQHIEKYAPLNRYRESYHLTDEATHKRNFGEIADSVHNNGAGLAEISYQVGKRQYTLLHKAEVIHLQDVAALINKTHYLGVISIVLLVLLGWREYDAVRKKRPMADAKGVLAVFAAFTSLIVLAVLVVGAKDVFYLAHELVFPDGHQWFFYYQDSLMSTIMKAPDLFAGIAVQILLLGIILFVAGLTGIRRILRKEPAQ